MKVCYVVHDENGKILRSGQCDDSVLDLQTGNNVGLTVIETDMFHSPNKYYVADGCVKLMGS